MKNQKSRLPCLLTDGFLALLPVFLLWPGTEGYQAIQEAKFRLFCLLFGGYLLLLFLLGAELALVRGQRPPHPAELWKKSSPAQKLVALYWLFSAISTLLSPLRQEALFGMTRNEGLLTITLYCSCFLCVSAFSRPAPWMAYLFGAAMTAFCLISILQLSGENPFHLYPAGTNYSGANTAYSGVFLGTTGNADLTAALLCLSIPVFWIFPLRSSGRLRFLLLLPLALCIFVLRKLNVQAGILGAGLGSLLALPAVLPAKKRSKRAVWLALALLLSAMLAVVWFFDLPQISLHELHELLHGRGRDEFGNGRILIWRQVLALVPAHLWFGTGPDTMSAAHLTGYGMYSAKLGGIIRYRIDTAHNEYLNILFHQGIFALLAYLGALAASAFSWLRRNGRSASAAAAGGAVLCYALQAFFGFSMCQTAGFFWVAWAVLERSLQWQEEKS